MELFFDKKMKMTTKKLIAQRKKNWLTDVQRETFFEFTMGQFNEANFLQ